MRKWTEWFKIINLTRFSLSLVMVLHTFCETIESIQQLTIIRYSFLLLPGEEMIRKCKFRYDFKISPSKPGTRHDHKTIYKTKRSESFYRFIKNYKLSQLWSLQIRFCSLSQLWPLEETELHVQNILNCMKSMKKFGIWN
jgi:hypothetical protein